MRRVDFPLAARVAATGCEHAMAASGNTILSEKRETDRFWGIKTGVFRAMNLAEETEKSESLAAIFHAAARTGFAGFFAMVLQVTLLMWIRTCMNYQYKHGCSLTAAFKVLYVQGGVRRFYSGYSIAVVQAPLGRFFDTAANSGVMALFVLYPAFDSVPTFVKTMAASATAASFKVSHVCPLER